MKVRKGKKEEEGRCRAEEEEEEEEEELEEEEEEEEKKKELEEEEEEKMKITVLSFCFKELEFNWKRERRTFDELYIIPCITRTRSLYHTDLYSSMQIPNCPKLSSQTSASLSTVHPVSQSS